MTNPSLRDRLAGGVYGAIVGDAVGVPYEFSPPGSIESIEWGHRGTHNQLPGTWSDDGALMLALLDSLLAVGFDLEDQGQRFVNWSREGAYTPDGVFDVGSATRAAVNRIASGTPASEAGGTGEDDNGNGSLMRILPIALVSLDQDDDILFGQASASSAVTHGHPRSRITCAAYTFLARNLIVGNGDRSAAMKRALAALERQLPSDWRQDFAELAAWKQRRGTGYVIDCFWSAWDAFSGAASYSETVERAIRYGVDTDTTACVAGGLAGIYWGVEAIPSEWRSGMRGQEIVEPLMEKLLESR